MSQNMNSLQIMPYVGAQHMPVIDQDNPLLNLPDDCLKNICDRLSLRDFVFLASTCKDARRLVDLFNEKTRDNTRFFLSTLLNTDFKPREIIVLPLPPSMDLRSIHGKVLLKSAKCDLARESLPSIVQIVNSNPKLKHPYVKGLLKESILNGQLDLADYLLEFYHKNVFCQNYLLPSLMFEIFSQLIKDDNIQSCKYVLQNCTFSSDAWINLLKKAHRNPPIKQLLLQHPPVDDKLLHMLLSSSVEFFQSFKEYSQHPQRLTSEIEESLYRCLSVSILMKHSDVFERPENFFHADLVRFLQEPNGCKIFMDSIDVKSLSDSVASYYLELSADHHDLFDLSIKILQEKKASFNSWIRLFSLKKIPLKYPNIDWYVKPDKNLNQLRQQLRLTLPDHPFFNAIREGRFDEAKEYVSHINRVYGFYEPVGPVDSDVIDLVTFDALVIAAVATKSYDCLKMLVRQPAMSSEFFKNTMPQGFADESTLNEDDAKNLLQFLANEVMSDLVKKICDEYTHLDLPKFVQ
jgi:hypothetical protein